MIINSHLDTNTVTAETIDYVIHTVTKAVCPRKIILFGSQAHGGGNANSDIDLLIITGEHDDTETVRLSAERALRGRKFGVDLLVRTPAEVAWNLQAENPFYTEAIMRNGRVVYEC